MIYQQPIVGYDPPDPYDIQVGWFGSKLVKKAKKAVKSVTKAATSGVRAVTSVAKVPLIRKAAGIAAFAFPAVGVPAVAALAAASKVNGALKSPNPRTRATAKALVANTVKAAKSGNPDAVRGAKVLLLAQRAAKARTATVKRTAAAMTPQARARAAAASAAGKAQAAAPARSGHLVLADGTIIRGKSWRVA